MSDVPRVLMIGDDPALRDGLRRSVSGPLELEHCWGSCDALNRLRREAFDVLLTNPATPVHEDLALVPEIGRVRPGVRTIVLTPATPPEDLIAALRAHVFAVFSSPFDVREVAEMVTEALKAPEWRDGIAVVSGLTNWITLRVSCRLVTAERLYNYLSEWPPDLSEDERQRLAMAFREMLLNAMEHGAGFDPHKVIEVTAARTERAVVFHLKDPGPGFDRRRITHAAAPDAADSTAHLEERLEAGLRAGGFGILVAGNIVDELVYNERGNEVLMIKHT